MFTNSSHVFCQQAAIREDKNVFAEKRGNDLCPERRSFGPALVEL
jgi:hypothetical protein